MTIRTGVIPNSECPKCGAPLAVREKRDTAYLVGNPRKYFVACTMYHVTGCNHMAKVTPEIEKQMEQDWQVFMAQPAEF